MTIDTFWQIIEASKKNADGTMDGHVEALTQLLSRLPTQEIVQFDHLFHQQLICAYSYDLWGAAYLIGQGCSDDGFMDFRTWLISQGRERFEAALRDPENLLSFTDDAEDIFFEEFAYIASEVYEERTGDELPDHPERYPREPSGEPLETDASLHIFPAFLAHRYPKIWERYGNKWQ